MSVRWRHWRRELAALAYTFPEVPVLCAIGLALLAWKACS